MTEIPDKQTEGTARASGAVGAGRDAAPSTKCGRAVGRASPPADRRGPPAATPMGGDAVGREPIAATGGGPMTVLPGEKLSRAGRGPTPVVE